MNNEQPTRREVSIVDDDASVLGAMVDLMNALGFVVQGFAQAEDFLASQCRHSTECLLADVRMPGMTGIELHRRLVASGESIPTILMTAYPDERARKRALQAGVIAYLSKPVCEDDLLRSINFAFENRKAS